MTDEEIIEEALLLCIEHWEENLDMLILNELSGSDLMEDVSTSSLDCALCTLFWWACRCKGCPISEETGQRSCGGTPFQDVIAWVKRYEADSTSYEEGYEVFNAEIKFLYSLLEQEEEVI